MGWWDVIEERGREKRGQRIEKRKKETGGGRGAK